MEIFFILFFMIVVAVIIISAIYGINNYRSIIRRAKKIDPTVTTYEEAQFVLKRNIAENVSKAKTTENTIFCRHCGETIVSDSKFCNKCGKEQ